MSHDDDVSRVLQLDAARDQDRATLVFMLKKMRIDSRFCPNCASAEVGPLRYGCGSSWRLKKHKHHEPELLMVPECKLLRAVRAASTVMVQHAMSRGATSFTHMVAGVPGKDGKPHTWAVFVHQLEEQPKTEQPAGPSDETRDPDPAVPAAPVPPVPPADPAPSPVQPS